MLSMSLCMTYLETIHVKDVFLSRLLDESGDAHL